MSDSNFHLPKCSDIQEQDFFTQLTAPPRITTLGDFVQLLTAEKTRELARERLEQADRPMEKKKEKTRMSDEMEEAFELVKREEEDKKIAKFMEESEEKTEKTSETLQSSSKCWSS